MVERNLLNLSSKSTTPADMMDNIISHTEAPMKIQEEYKEGETWIKDKKNQDDRKKQVPSMTG